MKKDIVSLQWLATFLRDVAYSDNQSHHIHWSLNVIHPSTNDGCVGFSGGLWHDSEYVKQGEGWVSISFSYDELNGIYNFKRWIDGAEIRDDYGAEPTFNQFQQICIKAFNVKKIYRDGDK